MDYLMEISVTVLVAFLIYVFERYGRVFFDKIDQERINEMVAIAVEATEQLAKMKDMTKEEKFHHAFDYADKKFKEKGIRISVTELKFLIEAHLFRERI